MILVVCKFLWDIKNQRVKSAQPAILSLQREEPDNFAVFLACLKYTCKCYSYI